MEGNQSAHRKRYFCVLRCQNPRLLYLCPETLSLAKLGKGLNAPSGEFSISL
jgi:hypothetical protein